MTTTKFVALRPHQTALMAEIMKRTPVVFLTPPGIGKSSVVLAPRRAK